MKQIQKHEKNWLREKSHRKRGEIEKNKDIHLNLVGVPKTQVNVKKTSQDKNSDDYQFYKISIDTDKEGRSQRKHKRPTHSGKPNELSFPLKGKGARAPIFSSDSNESLRSVIDYEEPSTSKANPPRKDHQKPGKNTDTGTETCFTPDERKKKLKIVGHPARRHESKRVEYDQPSTSGTSAKRVDFAVYEPSDGSSSESEKGVPYKRQAPQKYAVHDVKNQKRDKPVKIDVFPNFQNPLDDKDEGGIKKGPAELKPNLKSVTSQPVDSFDPKNVQPVDSFSSKNKQSVDTRDPRSRQPLASLDTTNRQLVQSLDPRSIQPLTSFGSKNRQPVDVLDRQPRDSFDSVNRQPSDTMDYKNRQPVDSLDAKNRQPVDNSDPGNRLPVHSYDPGSIQPVDSFGSRQPIDILGPINRQPTDSFGPMKRQPSDILDRSNRQPDPRQGFDSFYPQNKRLTDSFHSRSKRPLSSLDTIIETPDSPPVATVTSKLPSEQSPEAYQFKNSGTSPLEFPTPEKHQYSRDLKSSSPRSSHPESVSFVRSSRNQSGTASPKTPMSDSQVQLQMKSFPETRGSQGSKEPIVPPSSNELSLNRQFPTSRPSEIQRGITTYQQTSHSSMMTGRPETDKYNTHTLKGSGQYISTKSSKTEERQPLEKKSSSLKRSAIEGSHHPSYNSNKTPSLTTDQSIIPPSGQYIPTKSSKEPTFPNEQTISSKSSRDRENYQPNIKHSFKTPITTRDAGMTQTSGNYIPTKPVKMEQYTSPKSSRDQEYGQPIERRTPEVRGMQTPVPHQTSAYSPLRGNSISGVKETPQGNVVPEVRGEDTSAVPIFFQQSSSPHVFKTHMQSPPTSNLDTNKSSWPKPLKSSSKEHGGKYSSQSVSEPVTDNKTSNHSFAKPTINYSPFLMSYDAQSKPLVRSSAFKRPETIDRESMTDKVSDNKETSSRYGSKSSKFSSSLKKLSKESSKQTPMDNRSIKSLSKERKLNLVSSIPKPNFQSSELSTPNVTQKFSEKGDSTSKRSISLQTSRMAVATSGIHSREKTHGPSSNYDKDHFDPNDLPHPQQYLPVGSSNAPSVEIASRTYGESPSHGKRSDVEGLSSSVIQPMKIPIDEKITATKNPDLLDANPPNYFDGLASFLLEDDDKPKLDLKMYPSKINNKSSSSRGTLKKGFGDTETTVKEPSEHLSIKINGKSLSNKSKQLFNTLSENKRDSKVPSEFLGDRNVIGDIITVAAAKPNGQTPFANDNHSRAGLYPEDQQETVNNNYAGLPQVDKTTGSSGSWRENQRSSKTPSEVKDSRNMFDKNDNDSRAGLYPEDQQKTVNNNYAGLPQVDKTTGSSGSWRENQRSSKTPSEVKDSRNMFDKNSGIVPTGHENDQTPFAYDHHSMEGPYPEGVSNYTSSTQVDKSTRSPNARPENQRSSKTPSEVKDSGNMFDKNSRVLAIGQMNDQTSLEYDHHSTEGPYFVTEPVVDHIDQERLPGNNHSHLPQDIKHQSQPLPENQEFPKTSSVFQDYKSTFVDKSPTVAVGEVNDQTPFAKENHSIESPSKIDSHFTKPGNAHQMTEVEGSNYPTSDSKTQPGTDSGKQSKPLKGLKKRRKVKRPTELKDPFGAQQDAGLVYVGKIPNTTYNVFFNPESSKKRSLDNIQKESAGEPRNKQPKQVSHSKSAKLLEEGPKGIVIFVNKKTDDKRHPFERDDGTNVYDSPSKANRDGSPKKAGRPDERSKASEKPNKSADGRSKHSDSHNDGYPLDSDKSVVVERSPSGTTITRKHPCGCLQIIRSDPENELVQEDVVSAYCQKGSLCEVSHPELQKNQRFISLGAGLKSQSFERRPFFPDIDIIADGIISKKPIKPRPPAPTMRGANFTGALHIKSNKFNGVCNFYFDPRLKDFLRNNMDELKAMLGDGNESQHSYNSRNDSVRRSRNSSIYSDSRDNSRNDSLKSRNSSNYS